MKLSFARFLVLSALLLFGMPSSAEFPNLSGANTPDALSITVNKLEFQTRLAGDFHVTAFDTPHTINVIGTGSQIGGLFASSQVDRNKYTGVQLTLNPAGQFSGADPCTGSLVTDADVRLSDNNGADDVLIYEQAHPVLGLAPGAVPMDEFTVAATPINLRLIFPVTNSLVCLSDLPPALNVGGKNTGLLRPFAVTHDDVRDQFLVTNFVANRVTVYGRSDIQAAADANVPPTYTIAGTDTQLNAPTGIALNYNAAHPLADADKEVAVANNAGDSVSVYLRAAMDTTADGNVAPTGTLSGANTDLNGPGGLYIDTTNQQMVVTNGGDNSINIYNLDAAGKVQTGDTAPVLRVAGGATGLSSPCGVAVDEGSGDLYVANNRSNTVTVYRRNDFASYPDGNIPPAQVIAGDHTELATPCGIALDTSQSPPVRFAVTSSGADRVLFFNTLDDGDVYPSKAMRGSQTLISGPGGLALDPLNKQLAITSQNNSDLGLYSIADNAFMPHLHDKPMLTNDVTQQTVYARYFFVGTLDRATGQPIGTGTPSLPVQYAGYNFGWKIVDNNLRQSGDANSARLFPPENVVWTLADGSVVSSLALGCASFTPFTTLQLFTNCSQPLIAAPFPAAPGDYRLIAILLAQPNIKKITLNRAPLTAVQVPRLKLTISIPPPPGDPNAAHNTAILGMNWSYWEGDGATELQAPFPLLQTQQVQITLTAAYNDINPCYKQTAGNSPSLVYSSPAQGRDVRSLADITNNRCPILLKDVSAITFTATDPFGTEYIYQLTPVDVTP